MKKVTFFLLVIALISNIFVGCSGSKEASTSQKTEEELREEVKAEMEAEVKLKEQLKKEIEAEMEKEENSNSIHDDIYNQSTLFEFVKDQFRYENYDEFDGNVVIYILDVTGNGSEEAILVDQGSNAVPIVFVTLDNGHYKILPSDLHSGRYASEVWLDSGFVMLKTRHGGSSEHLDMLNIGHYNGSEVKGVAQFDLNYGAGSHGVIWKGDSTINCIDGYKEFEYNYNLYINNENTQENKHTQDIRKHYKFDSEKEAFIITELPGGFDHLNNNFDNIKNEPSKINDTDNAVAVKDDLSQGYVDYVENNNLNIQYNNTGNKVEILESGKKYECYHNHNSDKTFAPIFSNVTYCDQSKDGSKIYFTTDSSNKGMYQVYMYDVYTSRLQFITNHYSEEPFTLIKTDPYIDYIIVELGQKTLVKNNGEQVCKLGKEIKEDLVAQITNAIEAQKNKDNDKNDQHTAKSNDNTDDKVSSVDRSDKGYINEEVHGKYIDYDKFRNVIFPWRYDGLNANKLASKKYCAGGEGTKTYFTIIGEVENLTAIRTFSNPFTGPEGPPKPQITLLGDGSFKDVIIEIEYGSRYGIEGSSGVRLECDIRYPNGQLEHVRIYQGLGEKIEPMLYRNELGF
ncbi:hypothetical protein [Crassaminicella profunda]|uniref:hypothetical protein n=1 Tax=Crassaminicella profunda TaxID=1286698 RepID=UPI001CA6E5EA|nr:hypothetical protein [Crassaminicella profunda]QZY57246.1 hypothetical protein K7H06_10135 [Crassaminicella profunda]